MSLTCESGSAQQPIPRVALEDSELNERRLSNVLRIYP